MNENSSAYHAKLQRILDAQSKITDINKARQADGEEKRVNKEDNDPQLMGEAKTAMHDMLDMIVNHSSDQLGLEERVTMLNATKGVYLTQCRVTYYTKNSMKPVSVSVTISSHYGCLLVG